MSVDRSLRRPAQGLSAPLPPLCHLVVCEVKYGMRLRSLLIVVCLCGMCVLTQKCTHLFRGSTVWPSWGREREREGVAPGTTVLAAVVSVCDCLRCSSTSRSCSSDDTGPRCVRIVTGALGGTGSDSLAMLADDWGNLPAPLSVCLSVP